MLRELTTTVISAEPQQPEERPAKNRKKSSVNTDKLFEVVLHDTVLFPEGGGQPSDIGIIKTCTAEYEVTSIQRRGGQAVHFVKAKNITTHRHPPITIPLVKDTLQFVIGISVHQVGSYKFNISIKDTSLSHLR